MEPAAALKLALAQSSAHIFCIIETLRTAAVRLPVPIAEGRANTAGANDLQAVRRGDDFT